MTTYFVAPGQQKRIKIKIIVEVDSADLLEEEKNTALKAIMNMWKHTMHSSAVRKNYDIIILCEVKT